MRYPDRATVCISSQAGCGMACPFCATGQGGLTRNLSTAEIVEQVVAAAAAMASGRAARRSRPAVQRRVHGHGRAAGQLRARCVAALRRAASPPRRTASACPSGRSRCPPSGWCRPSGGSPTRACRSPSRSACTPPTTSCATPSSRQHPVARCRRSLDAADAYAARTGRRYSDRVRADPRRQRPAASAPTCSAGCSPAGSRTSTSSRSTRRPGSDWDASPRRRSGSSSRRLRAAGVPTTVRDTRGRDIDGACGQLAAADIAGAADGLPSVAAAPPAAGPVEPAVPLGSEADEDDPGGAP